MWGEAQHCFHQWELLSEMPHSSGCDRLHLYTQVTPIIHPSSTIIWCRDTYAMGLTPSSSNGGSLYTRGTSPLNTKKGSQAVEALCGKRVSKVSRAAGKLSFSTNSTFVRSHATPPRISIIRRLDECEWMLRPELLNGRLASRGQPQTTSCRFPDDRGRSDLARRPACRLVLSIHDELLYEVGKNSRVIESTEVFGY